MQKVIKHLVIDTNFILGKIAEFNAENIYTTQEVLDEVRDEQSLEFLNSLAYFNKIKIQKPSVNSLQRVRDACFQIGELGSVSAQDVGVLALAVDVLEQFSADFQFRGIDNALQQQYQGVFFDSNAPSKTQLRNKAREVAEQEAKNNEMDQEYFSEFARRSAKKGQPDISDILAEFKPNVGEAEQIGGDVAQTREEAKPIQQDIKPITEAETAPKSNEAREIPGWGNWATAENANVDEMDLETVELSRDILLFTQDFAMQNIALQLNVPLITQSAKQITKLVRYALKCPACCAIFVDLHQVIAYKRNKPFYKQLLNDSYNMAELYCPECANKQLTRVACYVTQDKITFSKGRKYYRNSECENYCDVSKKQFASIRNKHLLHPELYQERLGRVILQNKKGFEFGTEVKGAAGNERGDEVAYFLRRNRKGVKFAQNVK